MIKNNIFNSVLVNMINNIQQAKQISGEKLSPQISTIFHCHIGLFWFSSFLCAAAIPFCNTLTKNY